MATHLVQLLLQMASPSPSLLILQTHQDLQKHRKGKRLLLRTAITHHSLLDVLPLRHVHALHEDCCFGCCQPDWSGAYKIHFFVIKLFNDQNKYL